MSLMRVPIVRGGKTDYAYINPDYVVSIVKSLWTEGITIISIANSDTWFETPLAPAEVMRLWEQALGGL